MLKKENRLTKNKDFDRTWKAGHSVFDKILGVKAVANNLAVSRFGILVGLKISKKAVERNKIKRRIREALRPFLEKVKTGLDIMIVSLPPIADKNFQEIESSLHANFNKLKILK